MTAIAAERSHLMRWAASAVVVVGLHALGVAALLAWHDRVGVGDESPAIVIDLAPYVAPSESTEDLAPGPLQQQAAAPAPEEKVEPKVEPKPEEKVEARIEPEPQEKIEVPPAPVPPVAALTPPEAVEPPPVTPPEPMVEPAPPTDTPPALATTAPPRQHHASVAETNAWHKEIVTQIESHLVYPAAAQARRQKGVVQVAFSFNRQGRVISSQIVNASGYAALDQAALETLQKAQPFPPPPANMPGDVFPFTIPLRFRIQ